MSHKACAAGLPPNPMQCTRTDHHETHHPAVGQLLVRPRASRLHKTSTVSRSQRTSSLATFQVLGPRCWNCICKLWSARVPSVHPPLSLLDSMRHCAAGFLLFLWPTCPLGYMSGRDSPYVELDSCQVLARPGSPARFSRVTEHPARNRSVPQPRACHRARRSQRPQSGAWHSDQYQELAWFSIICAAAN